MVRAAVSWRLSTCWLHVDDGVSLQEQGAFVLSGAGPGSQLGGAARDTVWELNRHADMPDLAVIVNARADVIEKRLTSRGAHSRYEREPGSSERECVAFREAASAASDNLRPIHPDVGG